jgi:hypothetical protein
MTKLISFDIKADFGMLKKVNMVMNIYRFGKNDMILTQVLI